MNIKNIALCLSLMIQIPSHAAVYIVESTADTNTPTTLRFAINQANLNPGSTINFAIGSGVQTITLGSALPAITADGTTIDGFTQPGWSVDDPQIVLDCNGFGGVVISGASNCTIQGLVVNNAGGGMNAITIESNGNAITNDAIYGCFIGTNQTGTAAAGTNSVGINIGNNGGGSLSNIIVGGINSGQGNLISGNPGFGIVATSITNLFVRNNRVGTTKAGNAAIPNASGIGVGNLTNSIIGGPTAAYRNIISGNTTNGIGSLSANTNLTIQGNYIGTDITGTSALGNGTRGIFMGGGTGIDITNNICSANNIGIFFFANTNSTIQSNFIGTDATGTINLGNTINGIRLFNSSNNNIVGGTNQENVISFNGSAGILIDTTSNNNQILSNIISLNGGEGVLVQNDSHLNPILMNSIFSNAANGIELNNGNHDQESPIMLAASDSVSADNKITVIAQAPATSTPMGANFRLEFFINEVNNNPITEGKTFIGAIDPVAPSEIVTATFTVPLPTRVGQYVSATATALNNTGDAPGDTSEFTNNILIIGTTCTPIAMSPIVVAILTKYPC